MAEDDVDASSPPWVVALGATPGADARRVIGGKALNLGRMLRAGLPVPDGFCVTTAAFDQGIRAALAEAQTLTDARERVSSAPLPAPLEAAILEAHHALGEDVVMAVRSSAVDEDGARRSFAGQQTTVLNVRGAAALLDAVREVWASVFDASALLYRSRLDVTDARPTMAVVVQRLVDPEVAGVLFTRNPVDEGADELLICAAYGLGETVVGGGEADTFYIDRSSRQVLRETIGDKRVMLRPLAGGIEAVEVSAQRRAKPCLSAADIDDLVAISRQVERLLGGAQDIEFARDDARLWLLQARPITPAVATLDDGASAQVFTNANVGEALPGVGTPMTWSLIRAFARRGFETAFGALGLDVPESYGLFASVRGRIYLNISEFFSIASQIPLLDPDTLVRVSGAAETEAINDTVEQLGRWRFLWRLPLTIPRQIVSQLMMPRSARAWERRFDAAHEAFWATDLTALSRQALLEQLGELDDRFNFTGEVMLACSSNFLLSYVVVSEALRWLGGSAAAAEEGQLFSGLTQVSSAAPGLELLEMARYVQDRPALLRIFSALPEGSVDVGGLRARLSGEMQGRVLLGRFDRFLKRWGHRAPLEAELATPRWRDDPSFLFEVIRGHLSHGARLPSAREIEADAVRQREETTQLIRRHFLTGLGVFFRALLRWSQRNARRREALRSLVVACLGMYRRIMLEVGRRLVDAGALCVAADVFFLSYDEVHHWLEGADETSELRFTVAYRRCQYRAFQAAPAPPDTFTLVSGQEVPPRAWEEPTGDDSLRGLPGAPGLVSGRARVVHSLEDGDHLALQPGEILVAPFTDVGWTPLFLVAAGVVTDRGGPLSHSCVVAREYGIPAVVNTQIATRTLRTGDLVTVDGRVGLVRFDRA